MKKLITSLALAAVLLAASPVKAEPMTIFAWDGRMFTADVIAITWNGISCRNGTKSPVIFERILLHPITRGRLGIGDAADDEAFAAYAERMAQWQARDDARRAADALEGIERKLSDKH